MRPRVQSGWELHCEDDLTVTYSKIISTNIQLKEEKEDKAPLIEEIQRLVGAIMVKA